MAMVGNAGVGEQGGGGEGGGEGGYADGVCFFLLHMLYAVSFFFRIVEKCLVHGWYIWYMFGTSWYMFGTSWYILVHIGTSWYA